MISENVTSVATSMNIYYDDDPARSMSKNT